MPPSSFTTSISTDRQSDLDRPLQERIRADQLLGIRRSVLIAIPVNIILGGVCAIVAYRHAHRVEGIVWYLVALLVNSMRALLCYYPRHSTLLARDVRWRGKLMPHWGVDRQLLLCSLAAICSGLVWATLALLCDFYTSPEMAFYLVVVCGITAGAATHGAAYARVPLLFITPPLLSIAACLWLTGSFDQRWLAATALLYLGALTRSTLASETEFRRNSSLKNEATALAESLHQAHLEALKGSDRLNFQAWHDALTGLLNRAGFMREAEARRALGARPVCLMLLDLDGFKAINDVLGHRAGDEALIEVGRRLNAVRPTTALLGRLGGDEFAVLMDIDVHPSASPTVLASRFIDAIAPPVVEGARIGVSIGMYLTASGDLTEMLTCADVALYAAKENGRNQYRMFDGALRRDLEIRRDIERDLPMALESGALEVWFQPIFGQAGLQLDSFEALLRWQHPILGWINPEQIVFLASRSGLSEPLLKLIVQEVSAMIRFLHDHGMTHLRVAMNISPREMAHVAADQIVLSALRAANVPASMIEIEITENSTMDLDIIRTRLNAMSQMGIRIAIDDFGVGFSTLASLRHPYVGRVKIDRSFVSGMNDVLDNQALVRSVIDLGRSLDIDVVAEGVEREVDLNLLRTLGCQFMQGFLLGRPMPKSSVMTLLEQDRPYSIAI